MKDALIPLGLLLFLGFLVYAIVHTARKQRMAKARVFKDFAEKCGLSYRAEDDGKAQGFARDFDGIGRFSSPSLGRVIPKDVVAGVLNGLDAILFRHSTRFAEGWTREWFVAGVTSAETLAERCAVQFCEAGADTSMYLRDPVMKEQKIGSMNLVVRAADASSAGRLLDEDALNRLAELAENLSIRPEIQVRGMRIVVYPADRNETVDDVETLEDLFEFARSAARL